MNYTYSITSGKTTFYYLHDPYMHGPNLHRLDGPGIEHLEENSGAYYIDSKFIGNYPQDKELYEEAVEIYKTESI